MEHIHKTYIFAGVALIAGILIGLFAGTQSFRGYRMMNARYSDPSGARHMMPDGSTMNGMDMDDMMKNMNAGLQGKTGDAFDKEFVAEMIVHHQGAIDMAKLALTNAKHAEIKTLANAIIAAQTKEITQMKAWQTSWYASSDTAGLGEHCGGNMTTARSCSTGLRCAPTAGSHLPMGDVGGTCVKE